MKRIGIIGVGGIARGRHIPELSNVGGCKITAICDIDEAVLTRVGDNLKLDAEHRFTDYKKLIDCDDVDAVEICTPNYLHIEMAEYAAEKGKAINIEKPLCLDARDAEGLFNTVKQKGIPNMMCFSYRFFPAVRYAKWIMDKGLIGRPVSVDVAYLKSSAFWEGRRLDWRFVKKYAGTGVLGDLGVHLVDMAQLLVGDIKTVAAMSKIVVEKRLELNGDRLCDVETDDICTILAKIEERKTKSEVFASFNITRCAIGNQNTIKYDIYGTEGMISFNLNSPNELAVCIGEVDKRSDALHTVKVPSGYRITQEQAFVDSLDGKLCDHFPSLEDGIKCQKVVDAICKSAQTGSFVNIE